MSYIVTHRTGEIGVRLALGAEPGNVVQMIVRQGSIVALAGIAVGLAVALAGDRLIESLLYGVTCTTPPCLQEPRRFCSAWYRSRAGCPHGAQLSSTCSTRYGPTSSGPDGFVAGIRRRIHVTLKRLDNAGTRV